MGTAVNVANVPGVATHIVMFVWLYYNTIVGSVGNAGRMQEIRTTTRSQNTMMKNPIERQSEKDKDEKAKHHQEEPVLKKIR